MLFVLNFFLYPLGICGRCPKRDKDNQLIALLHLLLSFEFS